VATKAGSPKVLAEFDPDAGEWGHCEAVAFSRYDQVVHDWLDGVLASRAARNGSRSDRPA
jgi:hypothetical protein